MRALTPAASASGAWPADRHTEGSPVAPAQICGSEPLLIDLQSLLTQTGIELIESLLMPAMIVHRKRAHMLKHDIDVLEGLAGDRHAPGHARASQVREQVQRWIHDGLLVTVRHQTLTEAIKPAAMARFFRLFGEDQRGCLITQSREGARQMLSPACWPDPRPTPRVVSVAQSGFVAMSPPSQPARAPSAPAAAASAPAAQGNPGAGQHDVPRAARPARPAQAGSPRANHPPHVTPQQQRWLDRLVDDGYVFVPDTSALMHSQKQTARRFFERELMPRLLSRRQSGPGDAPPPYPSCVWVHRRVRGELMRHARSDNDQKLVAKAADGLKALTMLADAGLAIDHDEAQGPLGAADSYADPALELLLRKHQRQQRLCILTQDRGLAAKLLAQRDGQAPTPGRAEVVRLCVDGTAAIEDWDGLLTSAEREQAAREVSVDARVEAQLAAPAPPPAPRTPAGSPRQPSASRAEATVQPLPNGARTLGTLKRWKDEQGFGFIQPDGGGPDLFLHIRALPPGSRTPREGDRLSCLVGRDGQGRLRAERAWPEHGEPRSARTSSAPGRSPASSSGSPVQAALLAILLVAALGVAWWLLRR
jgi:cold shock CspA family protein